MHSHSMRRVIFLFICLQASCSSAYQSTIQLYSDRSDFHPANSVELLTTLNNIDSIQTCYMQCHQNFQCRTFVYKSKAHKCSLYEGSVDTGNIIATTSTEIPSFVGEVIYTSNLFTAYGMACDQCTDSRYLRCLNNQCQCLPNTFWNGAMCMNQLFHGQSCSTTPSSCRNTGSLALNCDSVCLVCTGPATCDYTTHSNSSEPIAYWSFNGSLGDNLTTAVGSVSFASGRVGQAIRLSGGSYVSSQAFHNLSYQSFTMEMWIYPTAIVPEMGLISQVASPVVDSALSLRFNGNKLYITFGWDDSMGSTDLHANQWYHVAFIYDCQNRKQRFFLNGIEEAINLTIGGGTGPYGGQCGATKIGNAYGNVPFVGLIDEVSIWNRARTASEILSDATISG